MTDFKFQWPYERVGDVWLFRKFETSVLVCKGTPKIDDGYYARGLFDYLRFPEMVEVSFHEEYVEETDTVRMQQYKSEDTPFHYQIRVNMGDTLARWTTCPTNYMPKDALELAHSILEKHVSEVIPAMILKGKSTVYGQEMIRESNFHKYPESFRCDLYHRDFYRIGVEKPTSFAWILYRAGTNLLLHSDNVDMYIKHRMSQWDDPKYYWANMGMLVQKDPMDVHAQAMTYLKESNDV